MNMDLTALTDWLRSAPALAGVSTLWLDYAAPAPGQGGLFPAGEQELARVRTITGRLTRRCRATFTLRLLLPLPPGDDARARRNAALLLDLQRWVAAQSAAGAAPAFGDDAPAERVLARDGRLEKADPEGVGVYRLTIQAEYTLQYEVNEA